MNGATFAPGPRHGQLKRCLPALVNIVSRGYAPPTAAIDGRSFAEPVRCVPRDSLHAPLLLPSSLLLAAACGSGCDRCISGERANVPARKPGRSEALCMEVRARLRW